ncbi:probable N-acetyltransferase CML1 isoform X1 [Ornithorhynchus anatinus]|uniref:probable N-acetyltransferase CML1 isoform X1 n=1 Tax=Ornithorhynchus anatinus TaxID=9258 RepID=UPI0010A912CD|nr:probable N-acetyltransferase CML1 isoform X1 [Ornithorhynchus anatinus]
MPGCREGLEGQTCCFQARVKWMTCLTGATILRFYPLDDLHCTQQVESTAFSEGARPGEKEKEPVPAAEVIQAVVSLSPGRHFGLLLPRPQVARPRPQPRGHAPQLRSAPYRGLPGAAAAEQEQDRPCRVQPMEVPAAGDATASPVMGHYRIRQFREGDGEAVRDLFSSGITEHAPASFWHLVTLPRTGLFLLAVALSLFAATGSIPLVLAAPPVLLTALWEFLKRPWRDYVENALRTDLKDIRRSYLEADGCGFWVAESAGRVVGLVAARPAPDPSGGKRMQLLRMSVAKDQRGRGIAQALVRTVLRFARDRGCDAVLLNTTCVQYAAQKLYESMGFRKMSEEIPSLSWRVTGLCVFKYSYPLLPSP